MMNKRNMLAALAAISYSTAALAQEHAAAAVSPAGNSAGFMAIAVGFAIALAALGGALGQGKAISAALDGIARNPAAQGKIFVPMMVGLALIESLVIFSLYICLQLLGKF